MEKDQAENKELPRNTGSSKNHTAGDCRERTMDDKAFLYYGFTLDDALLVRDTISDAIGEDIDTISASGEEDSTIEDVLDRMPDARFDDAPVRFMMFLGFDDEDISASIKAFPKISKRPILCTLTENNLKWTVSALLEHLVEEDTRVKGRPAPQ